MIKQIACCDGHGCGKLLENNKGITIRGAILVAGTKEPAGLIGPEAIMDICASCFIKSMTPEFLDELRAALFTTQPRHFGTEASPPSFPAETTRTGRAVGNFAANTGIDRH